MVRVIPEGNEVNSRGHRPRLLEQKASDPERVKGLPPEVTLVVFLRMLSKQTTHAC